MKNSCLITLLCIFGAVDSPISVFAQQNPWSPGRRNSYGTAEAISPSAAGHAGILERPVTNVADRYTSPFGDGVSHPNPWQAGQSGSQFVSPALGNTLAAPSDKFVMASAATGEHSSSHGSALSGSLLSGPGHSWSPPMIMQEPRAQLISDNPASMYVPIRPQHVSQNFVQSQYMHSQFAPAPSAYAAGATSFAGCASDCTGGSQNGCSANTSGAWIPDELLPVMKNQQRGGLRSSFGGELRYRFMDESNRLRAPGPGQSNYNLWRFTPYVSITAAERVTFFTQGIDASAFGYDAPYSPAVIDENRSDLLQAYIEAKITERLSYRYGRQFLNYGSERLLSSFDWGNTYRNFEGHKLRFEGDDWDIDLFSMKSVNGAAGNAFRPTAFDVADSNRRISGVYVTYKGMENTTWDMYWLSQENDNDLSTQHDGDRQTIGLRWARRVPVSARQVPSGNWIWDVETAYQFGKDDFGTGTDLDVNAGLIALEGGYVATGYPWSPSFEGIFYWGSGDDNPTDGENHTFSTLYPNGHKYWGLIDNLNGQNLIDYGLRTAVRPTEKLSITTTLHWFNRASASDAVYSFTGDQFAVGSSGKNIGAEADFVGTWDVSKACQVQVGYSWFGYGAAIDNSSPRDDAEQFWVMTNLRF